MDERELKIVLRARDEASQTLRQVGDETNRLSDFFKNNIKEAGLLAGAAVGGFAAMTKVAIDNAAAYEQNRIAFETMLGTADKARDLLAQVSEFARKTPFELPQVVEGTRRLLAYNVAQKDIIPTFRMLGDIAAGVGTDKLPQLILAFGQVKAATHLTGMELRQFSETGVPLLSALAEHFHKTEAEVQDMVSAGEVGFADVQAVLQQLTSQGGLFFNGMERQAHSFNGVMSNLNDEFGRFVRQVVGINEQGDIREGSIFYYVRLAAEKLLPIMEQLTPKIAAAIDAMLRNKEIVVIIAGAIAGLLVAALVALIATFGTAILLAAAFAAAGAVLFLAIKRLIDIYNAWKPVVEDVINTIKQKWDELVVKVTDIVNRAKAVIDKLPQFVRTALDAIVGMVAAFNPVIRIGLELPDIVGAFNNLKAKAHNIGIPGFASGTDFAPGGLAMVGERGPELVYLPRGSQVKTASETRDLLGGGGGPLVAIQQVVIRSESDLDALAYQLDYYRRTAGNL